MTNGTLCEMCVFACVVWRHARAFYCVRLSHVHVRTRCTRHVRCVCISIKVRTPIGKHIGTEGMVGGLLVLVMLVLVVVVLVLSSLLSVVVLVLSSLLFLVFVALLSLL